MSNYTTFPTEAHDDRSVFIEYAMNIGRAYRNQATGLIDICRHFSQVSPQHAHQDGDLRVYNHPRFTCPGLTFPCRVLRVCDLALRSAANSGTEVTDEANQRFKEATQVLSRYSERWHPSLDPSGQ